MYNKIVLDHFQNPRNLQEPKEFDASGMAVNPVCGDVMTIYLNVDGEKVKSAFYKTMGCGAAIASGSILTEYLKGKTLTQAKHMTPQILMQEMGELPAIKMHCPELAVDALQKALKNLNQ
jgi:nitrogen fixation NifU-like protein